MIERIEFDSVEIAPGCSAHINLISEKGPLRPYNIVLTEEVAKGFFVTDIKIGKNSQLITTGAVAAGYFAQRGDVEDLLLDKLPRGCYMAISVTNGRKKPAKFAGFLRGVLEGDQFPAQGIPQTRQVMGLGSTIVPPDGRLTLRVQPQVPFKADCLVLPPEVSKVVHIEEVRAAGNKAELDYSNPTDLLFPPSDLKVADWLVIEVSNKTDMEQAFYGVCGGSLTHL